jgi:hypothetical protein
MTKRRFRSGVGDVAYPFIWVSSTINATSNTYESNESSLKQPLDDRP